MGSHSFQPESRKDILECLMNLLKSQDEVILQQREALYAMDILTIERKEQEGLVKF